MALTSSILSKSEEQQEPLVGLYTMYYRQSQVGNHILTKNFRFNGSLKEARARAEEHCTVINAKLNFVQPLISNLKAEEDFLLHGMVEKA